MYTYDYSYGDAAGFWAIIAAVWIVFLLLMVAYYVLFSVGLMKVMKAKGMGDRYRAWIPFWRYYILGSIIENEIQDVAFVFEGTKWILTFGGLAGMVLANIPIIGFIVPIAFAVYLIMCNAMLAKKYGTMVSMIITNILGLHGIGFLILGGHMEGSAEPYSEGPGYTEQNYDAGSYSSSSFGDGKAKDVEFEAEPKKEEVKTDDVVAPSFTVGSTTDDDK